MTNQLLNKLLVNALAAISLTLGSFSFISPANAAIEPYPAQGHSTHVKKMDFMRFGDHLFGYLDIFKDSAGINYAKVTFSNGTSTQYRLSATLVCELNGVKQSAIEFSTKVGWSAHGSVERGQGYRIKCDKNAKLLAYWSKTKLDVISIDDISRVAETALRVYISNEVIGELFGGDTVGELFN